MGPFFFFFFRVGSEIHLWPSRVVTHYLYGCRVLLLAEEGVCRVVQGAEERRIGATQAGAIKVVMLLYERFALRWGVLRHRGLKETNNLVFWCSREMLMLVFLLEPRLPFCQQDFHW